MGRRIDGGKRWDRGREVGIRSGAGRTGAERGEPCRVFEVQAIRLPTPTHGETMIPRLELRVIDD